MVAMSDLISADLKGGLKSRFRLGCVCVSLRSCKHDSPPKRELYTAGRQQLCSERTWQPDPSLPSQLVAESLLSPTQPSSALLWCAVAEWFMRVGNDGLARPFKDRCSSPNDMLLFNSFGQVNTTVGLLRPLLSGVAWRSRLAFSRA